MTAILSIAAFFFLSYFIFFFFLVYKGVYWVEKIWAAKSEGSQGQVSEGLGMAAAQTEESVIRDYDHGTSRWVKIQSAGPGADLSYPSEPEPLDKLECPIEVYCYQQLCGTSLPMLFGIHILCNDLTFFPPLRSQSIKDAIVRLV